MGGRGQRPGLAGCPKIVIDKLCWVVFRSHGRTLVSVFPRVKNRDSAPWRALRIAGSVPDPIPRRTFAFQQVAGGGPVEVPAFMGRHQFSFEAYLFKKALKIATGAEIRYHTSYHPEGYGPLYNRFYYQTAYTSGSDPEASVFFNFKIKRFRAYLMGDQLQTLLSNNNIPIPGYPTQELMIRFGF